ncbi:hypothetical protein [Winogradskyella sp.]|uniref:hypothetical protein n=2 Tax=Winogradskyella sp. TaxID=1883156 RepID=UPI003514F19C
MKKLILLLFHLFIINSIVAHPGIGIVMDKEGNVFYTDLAHVWKISEEGKRTIAVENVHTHELYLDSNGNLYGEHEWYNGEVTDTWGNYVWCLSKNGNFERVVTNLEGFIDNTTLIRDNEGNSYWPKKLGNSEVLIKQSVNGDNYAFSTHQFDDIRWMYFSKDDKNLYVVDILKIKKVTPSGHDEVLAENLKENESAFMGVADRHYVFGLWTDTQRNIYVALYGSGKVKKINPKGEITTVFNSAEGWSPCGGLIEKDGTLWIMEFSTKNSTRVRKVVHNEEDIIYGN